MKLDEIQLADFMGSTGLSRFKGSLGGMGGMSSKQKMAQKIFIKNFVQDAIINLQSAIQGGLVDPKLIPTGSSKPQQKATIPARPKAQDPTALNTYMKQMSATLKNEQDPAKKILIARELINYMADRKGTPEWNNSVGTAINVIKTSGIDKVTADKAIQKLKSGISAATTESKYDKLNAIFESIIYENQVMTISDFLSNTWYPNYMKGVDYSSGKQVIDKLIAQVQNTYNKDKGKAALTQLANTSYALSLNKGQYQPKQQTMQQEPEQQPSQTQKTLPSEEPVKMGGKELDPNDPNEAKIIAQTRAKDSLDKLKQLDPKAYSDLVKSLTA